MARPRRCLCSGITFKPNILYFKPQGVPLRNLKIVEISIEELESYRLRHINNLDQIDAAKKMRTSQSTYQRILRATYEKIGDALIHGKAIKIINHEDGKI
ncbi:DUF134 domain-containing protein [Candidatus Parcubacteria bacterium]|jgi:predicted DNA-binding protein (UPF0251 family)|nr:MAG: DUF134 domain-containing protein [Candidatus Parcubacteria bacterium]